MYSDIGLFTSNAEMNEELEMFFIFYIRKTDLLVSNICLFPSLISFQGSRILSEMK